MPFRRCLWDLDDDPDGNVVHIATHGLTKQDVEEVFAAVLGEEFSRSTGGPIVFCRNEQGELVAVIYEKIEDDLVYPVTAFVVGE